MMDGAGAVLSFDGMQNYRRLSVWRKAHAIALNIRILTGQMPREGNLGLIDQLRRAALSIPANIAEGSSRPTDKDFVKFLNIALASTTEAEYHLEFAADAGIIPSREFELRRVELIEVRKMLTGLIKYLRQTNR
jgi:four helix bundle protein